MIFNRDGTFRVNKKTMNHCGALEVCDDCWEHCSDWSPFGIWHCLVCRMPQAIYSAEGAGIDPVRCQFCGFDESIDCTSSVTAENEEPI